MGSKDTTQDSGGTSGPTAMGVTVRGKGVDGVGERRRGGCLSATEAAQMGPQKAFGVLAWFEKKQSLLRRKKHTRLFFTWIDRNSSSSEEG